MTVDFFCQICGTSMGYDVNNPSRKCDKCGSGQLGVFPPKHMAEKSNVGLRYSKGKTMMELLPPDALLYLGKIYTKGAEKYALRNWEKGMSWSQCYGPLMRHTMKFWSGEDIDEESGLLHSGHMVWNSVALLTYQLRGMTSFDDRMKIKLEKN